MNDFILKLAVASHTRATFLMHLFSVIATLWHLI